MFRTTTGLFVLAALAGCTTTETATRDQMTPWIGQTARTFGEVNSLVPVSVYDTPTGGRTFIYSKPYPLGSCGVTLATKAKPNNSEWVIVNMASTCPPGAF